MADKKWMKMFPIANYGEFNLDFLLEKYGEQDDRIKKVEEKNAEQDDRLDEDDTLIANLRADLTTETNQRTAADNSLSNRITAEVAARIAGDSTLQGNIDAEKAARQAADAQLSTDIASEASARTAADTALQSAINTEATARANADNSLLGNIQQEQQNRITMDQGLQAEIDAIPVVKANDNTGTAGGDLTSLKVGNTSYTVPQGGQGTTVVANPSGAATDTLNKLQVGSTIYGVSGGGGSSTLLNNKCLGYNATSNTLTYGHINTLASGQTTFYIDGDVNGTDTEDVCEHFGYLFDENNSMLCLPENPSCPALFVYITSSVGADGHTVSIFENIVNAVEIEYNKYDTLRFDFDYLSGIPKTLSRRHVVITNFMGGSSNSVAVSDTTGVRSATLTASPNPYQPNVVNSTVLFSDLEPGTYLVNFNMFWTVSGADTDAITSTFELAPSAAGLLADPETVRLPIVRNKDGNIVFNGQAIVNSYDGNLVMSIKATNSTNNFEYVLNDATSTLRVQKLY